MKTSAHTHWIWASAAIWMASAGSALAKEEITYKAIVPAEVEDILGALNSDNLHKVVTLPGITNYQDELHGQELNPLMGNKQSCLQEAIKERTQLVGRDQAERDINMWMDKLNQGEMSEMQYWTKVLECQDYCSAIMVDVIDCYYDIAAKNIAGFFLFDTGVGSFREHTRGDRASRGETFNNGNSTWQVVARMRRDPTAHLLLEGRASRVGNDIWNLRLSGSRSDAVRRELIKQGITPDRIHYRWIGEGEPRINRKLARRLQLTPFFEKYGEQTLNQSVVGYVYTPR